MTYLNFLTDARNQGLMPTKRIIYLGLGVLPPKLNSIKIPLNVQLSNDEFEPFVGLDIVLVYRGAYTKYGTLKRISDSLLNANPRRLMLIDLDQKGSVFLKLGNKV